MCQYKFYIKKLSPELSDMITTLETENAYHLSLEKIDKYYQINYEILGDQEYCDENMAHMMSDMIQKISILHLCEIFLKEKVGLSLQEQHEISQSFLSNNYLSRKEGFSYVTYYLLYLPIFYEIREKKGFNIDGWITFRMNQYHNLLKDLLEQFIKEYLAKKEVVSFIHIMRDASFFAVPLEEVIHLVFSIEGKVVIYNKAYKDVTAHYIKKYCKELLLDMSLTREDLILHVLLTLSPQKIQVHHRERAKNFKLLNTLDIIFEQSVVYCEGCEFCKTEE